jgi:hypothetical protein
MKWLIIQSDGKHKGQHGDAWTPNWYLRECYSIRRALLAYGHDADIWGPGHRNYRSDFRSDFPSGFFGYDGYFVAENYDMDFVPDLGEPLIAHKPRIQWIIDLHCQSPERYDQISARCNVILHSTRGLLPDYRKRHPRAQHLWFPNCIDDLYFDRNKYPLRPRLTDLLFIGGEGTRAADIRTMVDKAGMLYQYGITGEDYINAILGAKIQWNMGIAGDINYRTFETIGLGACLLTEHHADLSDLGFVNNVNCFTYYGIQNAVGMAKGLKLSAASDNLARVTEAGYQLSKTHTYTLRIRNLLDKILCSI